MIYRKKLRLLLAICLLLALTPTVMAQGSKADYERAAELPRRFSGKVTQQKLEPLWIGEGETFWYRQETERGRWQWFRVDSGTGQQEIAFDHKLLASQFSEIINGRIDPGRIQIGKIRNEDGSLGIGIYDKNISSPVDPLTGQLQSIAVKPGQIEVDKGDWRRERKDDWRLRHPNGLSISPNGQWAARVADDNLNIIVDEIDENGRPVQDEHTRLSTDGTSENYYTRRMYWSPDSTRLVVMKQTPGDERRVTIVDSTPDDQLQPKTDSYFYLKPGDQVPVDRPVLFDIASKRKIAISDELAPNPFDIRGVRWNKDASAFTYEYNQRGHQVYRVIEVDAKTGASRAVINEQPETFFLLLTQEISLLPR